MTDSTALTEATAGVPTILLVDWHDPRAVQLREAMDAEIGPRYAGRFDDLDPELAHEVDRAFAVDPADIAATFIVLVDDEPVAHAALRGHHGEWELKRLVTLPSHRGRGLSRALIAEVEAEVVRRGGSRLILQTGDRQPEAVRLYEGLGFTRIPSYEPYTIFSGSLCFAHDL